MRKSWVLVAAALVLAVGAGAAVLLKVGLQPDGTFLVATGQRIEPGTVAFAGRPIDLAVHPDGEIFAVLNKGQVLLGTEDGIIDGSAVGTDGGPSFRGCIWSPDGSRLFTSLSKGTVQHFRLEGRKLIAAGSIVLSAEGAKGNPVPGGMDITRDGRTLFVACANLGSAVEVDLSTNTRVREWQAQNIPFDVKLSGDEKTLIISNWAGREADEEEEEDEAMSGPVSIMVDDRGIAASGTVTLIDRANGQRKDLNVGLHPAGVAVARSTAYVANAASDTISEIDLASKRVRRTIDIRWGKRHIFGSMPNTLAVRADRLYACNGGDNAVCEIDRRNGEVLGFRPAGFFPVGICLSPDGDTAYVVNTKGNGSVQETLQGKAGNAHNFQGTVSVVDLRAPLSPATERVVRFNGWDTAAATHRPDLKVYSGAIKHILYIIKENRTYDQVLGDLPEGNGDASLCGLGEEITPNHHALAREFTLFDNAYVCGTNSAEGHQWALEGLANDYIERFYGGYSRSYPYDGGDAMAYSEGGFIWDAARAKGKSVKVYGEFCLSSLAQFEPKRPANWFEAWEDRESGENQFVVRAGTSVAGMRPFLHPNVICWPLLFSDQWRADKFIEDYERLSKADKVPNLMLLTLPCDHTAGTSPTYPTPRAMVADNDLAMGRIVEVMSRSPQWKNSCIFVMEDDAQAGPDHVDGHRTVCYVISPYTRRGFVDSTMYTQTSILRSIELMLGIDPMTQFDALATPFAACFTDDADLRPFKSRPNRIPLDERNPALESLSGKARFYAEKSLSLDMSDVDLADWYWLNRIVWHSLHGDRPYPDRRG